MAANDSQSWNPNLQDDDGATPAGNQDSVRQRQRANALSIDSLQLARRYQEADTPPLKFLHRAWHKLAQQRKANMDAMAGQLPSIIRAVSSGDQPFDNSAPLQVPNLKKWLELQDQYLSSWLGTFRFLHGPTVRQWLNDVHENHLNSRELWHGIGHSRAAVALMTVALGSMFPDKNYFPSQKRAKAAWLYSLNNGDQLFRVALELTGSEPGAPKLDSIQARFLQDLYLMSTCRMNQAWYTFGNTVQMITAMGLHRRLGRNRGFGPDVVRQPDYGKLQCDRRTFWCAYIIDKHLAMVTGRPSHFNDDSVDQEYPDCVNDEDMARHGPFRTHAGDCYLEALVSQIR
jgi:hypothetical protein